VLSVLAEFFPCFLDVRRPLKIGIRADLVAQAPVTEAEALRRYCNTRSYLCAMVAGEDRVDLDGKPVGVVTAEEVGQARGEDAMRARLHALWV
jgi:sRNA-binding protein